MILEFKTYALKEGTKVYENIMSNSKLPNEFIIVGEEDLGDYDCYKVQQLTEEGISLLGGLKIDESAYLVPKGDIELKKDDLPGIETNEIDIPKQYLTLDIIENIQRLNS